MSSDPIITVEGLGKRYRLTHQSGREERFQYLTLRDVLTERVRGWLPGPRAPDVAGSASIRGSEVEDFWALQDVSFEVPRGACIGIIGRNGAGKSTLLKILSRITEPTAGRVTLDGRVASLLEVGTGFHPELTGRENIYLNGAILGMTRAEIRGKFDEIVEFAEVSKFLDTPVKRYSSGMYMRLAFAVAAHLEPEILIVDEVLAVGDAQFQKKCLGKMEDVTHAGRTVIFVSHDMNAMAKLTSRVLLFESGRIKLDAAPSEAIAAYLRGDGTARLNYASPPSAGRHKITAVSLVTTNPLNVQVAGRPFEVQVEVSAPAPGPGLCLAFHVIDARGRRVAHLWIENLSLGSPEGPVTHRLVCRIPKLRLYMGQYCLQLYLSEPPGGKLLEVLDTLCPFEVVMHGHERGFPWRPDACTYLEEGGWELDGVPSVEIPST